MSRNYAILTVLLAVGNVAMATDCRGQQGRRGDPGSDPPGFFIPLSSPDEQGVLGNATFALAHSMSRIIPLGREEISLTGHAWVAPADGHITQLSATFTYVQPDDAGPITPLTADGSAVLRFWTAPGDGPFVASAKGVLTLTIPAGTPSVLDVGELVSGDVDFSLTIRRGERVAVTLQIIVPEDTGDGIFWTISAGYLCKLSV